jgi:aldehyde dehydrogenase (NAD+)
MTEHHRQFYIGGEWVAPAGSATLDVIDPSTEKPAATIALGTAEDVDRAVRAARAAFPAYSQTTKEERLALLRRVIDALKARSADLAEAIRVEMGAPKKLAERAQVPSGIGHFHRIVKVLEGYDFEEARGTTLLRREPVGVCGFITPWNWPLNQIACKVAPALAAGCTMVLKPSEIAPLDAVVLAEAMDAAGVPPGVFNLVQGDGPTVGAALSAHPELDMISFTGSTRAGVLVAKAAADTVKRVHQELGGKSANIILPDADLAAAVKGSVRGLLSNSGQSCNAGTRMFVPRDKLAEAEAVARAVAEKTVVGPPADGGTHMGPVVSGAQFERIQGYIQKGLDEGAKLVVGGPGRPEGLDAGFYVRPTVFSEVRNDMTIAREEIFGPVLAILPYDTVEEAVELANDSPYGLSGYVHGSAESAGAVARQLRTGMVHVNGAPLDNAAPFGGYKQSGNGREWGEFGLEEFLEVKSIFGGVAKSA